MPGSAAVPSRQPGGQLGGRLGDGRGLTGTGAVLVALAVGLAGVGVDVVSGAGLRTVFAVCFVLGCVIAAAVVHHEDLMAAAMMPPLLFVVLAAAASVIDASGVSGSWLSRRLLDVVTTMVTQAPVLLFATVATLSVVLARFGLYRASVRRRRARRAPGRAAAPSA